MINLLGDIHGNHKALQYAIDVSLRDGATALIQVGDFGLFQRNGIDGGFYSVTKGCPIPIYFLDGNHDDCSRWTQLTEVTQIWHDANLHYIPRGTVMEIDGRTIAFLGGAASIDKHTRIMNGWHWDPLEDIRPIDVERMIANSKDRTIDLFITHCPPNSVIAEHFDDSGKLRFGVGLDWNDPAQTIVQEMWELMGTPQIYSGHMHRSVEGMTYRILDIDELLAI